MHDRSIVVSLHDVSPHTFAACVEIMTQLEQIGACRCSLLVVPDHHHRGHFLKDPSFCAWLNDQVARGHEAVIHGYHHRRERQRAEPIVAKLTTRVYTADEGEFFDMERLVARELVAKARDEFRSLGLDPSGFIAPAWLLSDEAEGALRDLGIRYTTRLGSVLDLSSMRRTDSQSLCWSVRSAWRRVVSLGWNRFLFRKLRSNLLLRVAVHPVDLEHRAIWNQVTDLIRTSLHDRAPRTYEEWILPAQRQTSVSVG